MMSRKSQFILCCSLLFCFVRVVQSQQAENDVVVVDNNHRRLAAETDEQHQKRLASHLPLFHYSPEAKVIGPSSFPKPSEKAKTTHDDVIVPALRPVIGTHRADQDAVFVFAAEYPLRNYILFIESLRATGFAGDIVLAIHELDLHNKDIQTYLSSDPGVVVYTPHQVCFNLEMEEVESAKGGMRTCQFHELYGRQQQQGNNNSTVIPLPDSRPPRTIANTRYELYWIMALNYNPNSWILLIDARDTVFQSNPFQHVPRNTDPTLESGLLYWFGENMEATRIGKSKQNNKWIRTAYGNVVGDALADKPIICSGASMGEQVSLETYLRAMVNEADETGTVLMGSDQGFHNYLYYSHKLQNADRIHDIVVFDQGTGIVNNMGAMRLQALEEWGNGKLVQQTTKSGRQDYTVLNWDGTPSPVVHQFDRHKPLSDYFYKVKAVEYEQEWRKKQEKLDVVAKQS